MQSHNEIMLQIVQRYTPEIYIKTKQFYGLISDFFPNEEIGDLLKIVVEKNGSIEVYELIKKAVTQNLDQTQLVTEYRKTLDKISKKTFIDTVKLIPATDLLCTGLGYNITIEYASYTQTVTTVTTVTPSIVTDTPKPTLAEPANSQDDLEDLIDGIYNSVGVSDEELFNYIKGHICFAGASQDTLVDLKNGIANMAKENKGSKELIELQNYAKKLTNIDIPLIPKTPTLHFKIENNVLISYNAKSQYINIPNIVNEISDDAFRKNLYISTAVIPETVTKIGSSAFMECSNLIDVHLPSTVTLIKKSTFNYCTNLKYINLKYITNIENSSFVKCNNLPQDIINYIACINPKALMP